MEAGELDSWGAVGGAIPRQVQFLGSLPRFG